MPIGNLNATAITPNRRTIVTIGEPMLVVSEPQITVNRRMGEIGDRGTNGRDKDLTATEGEGCRTTYIPSIGWRLASNFDYLSVAYEQGDFDGARVEESDLQLGTGILALQTFSSSGSLTGQTTNQRSGAKVFQRQVGAGSGAWTAADLTGDKSAYPGPDDANSSDLLRVASSNADGGISEILFRYEIPGATGNSQERRGPLTRLYFPGPAGSLPSDPKPGTGRYCISILDDGYALLRERLGEVSDGLWVLRRRLPWASGLGNRSGHFVLFIRGDAPADPSRPRVEGERLFFEFHNLQGNALIETLLLTSIHRLEATHEGIEYRIPGPGKNPAQPTRIRVDERVEIRGQFSLQRTRYRTAGTLRSFVYDVGGSASADEPLYVVWAGDRPSGTTVACELYDAESGIKLTASGPEFSGDANGYKGFDPTSGREDGKPKRTKRKFYARLVLTTSDPTKSPTIRSLGLVRNPVTREGGGGLVTAKIVESVSVLGADSDPSHETARLVLTDFDGHLDILRSRSALPIRVEVLLDPNDLTKRSTIFSGRIVEAHRRRRGSRTRNGTDANPRTQLAKPDWATYDVRCNGEWMVLWQAKTTQAFDFSEDKSAKTDSNGFKPWKITDIARTLLQDKYAAENVDIPDLPVRLFSAGDASQGLRLEPLTEIGPFVIDLLRDYLGAWLVWDANATNAEDDVPPVRMGCWRMKMPPARATPKPLAMFSTRTVSPAGTLSHSLPAQTKASYGDRNDIPRAWIRKGTLDAFVVPPEGNLVIVTGTGVIPTGSLSAPAQNESLSSRFQNVNSFHFDKDAPPPPENHPDRLQEIVAIYYSDPLIGSQAQADFLCRRIADFATHGQHRRTFEAPLVLVSDPGDEKQRNPRPLLYGDPVLYEGMTATGTYESAIYYANPPSIEYTGKSGGDRIQMSAYDIFRTEADLGSPSVRAEGTR